MSARTLIVGIGNRMRGDDALGCMIAEKLAGRSDMEVIEHDGEPASLIERWQGFDRVILIDAVVSGKAAGTIFRVDLRDQKLSGLSRNASTHAFGVAEAVELARALGKLPRQIIFYGIEAGHFSTGGGLSPIINSALEKIKKQIEEELLCMNIP